MIGRLPLLLALLLLAPQIAAAADLPTISLSLGESGDPEEWFNGLKIIALLTILTLSPSILIMMTSFTRILIVLGFLRQALGTQQSPPAQVLVGLSLFMTAFIMMPVWHQIDRNALTPYLNREISQQEAFERAKRPLRTFMLRQTREKDLLLFLHAARLKKPKRAEETPFHVVVPAFVISELRTAFEIGFLIYIPFVVLDMVVASVLMSMGMMMLPPVMISLPFKIILFVLVDGWHLVAEQLIDSFKMG
ncbi:MAG: flagellar biosynthetic protein FliP [Zetaproteobacteria bacterium]|nr:MAG: flagellar biosynthetic protein FliP [Zetaproteobacteria bacterium]